MKRYTFEVTLHEDDDEFWEAQPTDHEVTAMLVDALEMYGIMIRRADGYTHARDTVRLVRMEEVDEHVVS